MSTLAELAEVAPRTAVPRFAPDTPVPVVLLGDVDAATATVTAREVLYGERPSSVRPISPGDLVLARLSPAMEEGRLGVVPRLDVTVVFASSELINLRPRPGVPVGWLRSFLRLDRVREELAVRMTGSTGRRRLPPRVLRALELPPLPDTETLVGAILMQDSIDSLEAIRTLALQRLAEMPRALLKQAAAGGPRQPLVTLGATIERGVTTRGSSDDDGPIVRPADLADGVFGAGDLAAARASSSRRGELQPGDVLVVCTHANLDRLGDAVVYRGEPEHARFSAQLARVRLPAERSLHPELLCAWMRTDEARRHVRARARRVAGQHSLGPAQLATLPVPELPDAEQTRLTTALAALAELRGLGSEQIATLRSLRQATLAQTFPVGRRLAFGDVAAPAGDDALAEVFAALGVGQQRLWQAIAQRADRFTLEDLLGQDDDRECARRGLRVLERIGVAVPEREREAVSYRRYDPELDAIADGPAGGEEG